MIKIIKDVDIINIINVLRYSDCFTVLRMQVLKDFIPKFILLVVIKIFNLFYF